MEWTHEHDIILVREILVVEPYKFKPGSRQSGQAWDTVADNLRKIHNPKFLVVQRSVRDRFRILQNRFKIAQREELKASGISPEPTELDTALEEITEKIAMYAENHQEAQVEKRDKIEKDKKSAEEMRKQAMESLVKTQKRKIDDGKEEKKKKTRKTGNETVQYLREKAELDREVKKEELRLREKEIEGRTQEQNNLMKQQFEMFQMQQQTQQQQMQQTMAMLSQQQNMLITLLGKFNQNN